MRRIFGFFMALSWPQVFQSSRPLRPKQIQRSLWGNRKPPRARLDSCRNLGLIAGPIHGFDDAAQAPEPDVPTDTLPGVPVWVWLGLAVLFVAPSGYWLGKRSPTDGTGGSA